MTLPLVVNASANRGRAAAEVAITVARLRERGVVLSLHRPTTAEEARELIAELARDGAERIVVLGGDGLVHQAANALAGSDTVLGIVPAGTGNDTARALDLPSDTAKASRVALAEPMPIDLIDAEGEFAVTVATLGFSVDVNARANRLRFPRGKARYTISSLVELPKMPMHQLTLTVDGDTYEAEANLLGVANTAYFGGGMKIAPSADPDDGLLDIVTIGPVSKAMFAALLPTVFTGQHVRSDHVTVMQAETITIDGPALDVWADGETLGTLPITMKVAPKTLLVAGARP